MSESVATQQKKIKDGLKSLENFNLDVMLADSSIPIPMKRFSHIFVMIFCFH